MCAVTLVAKHARDGFLRVSSCHGPGNRAAISDGVARELSKTSLALARAHSDSSVL